MSTAFITSSKCTQVLYFCLNSQEARREELLVNRLMRQSQQERRIATQLLQLRHEKAVICQNRIFREQQYEERRQKDFQEAMDREAVSNLVVVNPELNQFHGTAYEYGAVLISKSL